MIRSIKNFFTNNFLIKFSAFIFTLGILPMLFFMYGLDEKPEWIHKQTHHLSNDLIISVHTSMETSKKESMETLNKNAITQMLNEIEKTAFEQIKKSYDYDNLDKDEQTIITKSLKKAISALDIKNFVKYQDNFHDVLDSKLYGLYSMKKIKIDTTLQEVYENVNEIYFNELEQ